MDKATIYNKIKCINNTLRLIEGGFYGEDVYTAWESVNTMRSEVIQAIMKYKEQDMTMDFLLRNFDRFVSFVFPKKELKALMEPKTETE